MKRILYVNDEEHKLDEMSAEELLNWIWSAMDSERNVKFHTEFDPIEEGRILVAEYEWHGSKCRVKIPNIGKNLEEE